MTATQLAQSHGWEPQEPGWWTHPSYGGLVLDGARWRWYADDDTTESGSFGSLREAVETICREPTP